MRDFLPIKITVHRKLKGWVYALTRMALSDEGRTTRNHFKATGFTPDLMDPKGYHEKICWLKLYGMTPLHSFCADKMTAPAYIEYRLGKGHTPAQYVVTRNPKKLRPENIPADTCVIKTNHDSGGVFFVTNKSGTDWDAIQSDVTKRMARNLRDGKTELQYGPIRPGMIVEEYLQSSPEAPFSEIKVHCLNGKVELINQIHSGIQADSADRGFYRADWSPLDMNRIKLPVVLRFQDKPDYLHTIIEMAETLAKPFAFVRVDFFILGRRILVGELTFTPSSGNNRFTPDAVEMELGAKLDHRAETKDWQQHLAAAQKCYAESSVERM